MSATRRMATVLGASLALLFGMSSLAQADGSEQVVQGRYLELVSVTSEGAENLSPGDSMQWAVKVSAPGVEDGTISRSLVVGGDLAEYVEVGVETCTARPSSTRCPGATTLLDERGAASGESLDLGSQAATAQQWLLVRVSLPADAPQDAQSLAGTLSLHAQGAGEGLAVSPGGDTGGGPDGDSVDGSGGSTGGADDAATASDSSTGATGDASTGSDSSTGGFDTATTGSAENTQADLVPRGFLAATGMAVAVWLLAAAALLLLGEALRRGRRALTENDEHDKHEGDSRP